MEIFQRHKRPQQPVKINTIVSPNRPVAKPPLPLHQRRIVKPIGKHRPGSDNGEEETDSKIIVVKKQSPFNGKMRLAQLTQSSDFLFCVSPVFESDIFKLEMFKKMEKDNGQREFKTLQRLQHDHIVKLDDSYIYENRFYLGLEVSRYTLTEFLATPIPLQRVHLECISSSVRYTINIISFANFMEDLFSASVSL
jgi:hypothetical protein